MAGLINMIRRKKDPNATPKEDQGGPSVLAETIEKIALEVDYHGLADLYEASSWYARLFWSVIVIGALGAVIHDCYNIIMLFASNPSATKISEFQVKYLELPNVTVCNMGAFNQTELRTRLDIAGETDIQKQNEFIRYMMIMAYQTPPGNKTLVPEHIHPAMGLWNSMGLAGINETIDFLRETAYQCEGFLSDCEFAEEPFNCCDNDIFVYTDLGGCYTIRPSNATGPVRQTGRDSLAGVSVTTQMDVTEIAILEEWKSVGLRLQFGDYVSPFDFSSMLHLPPGMLALVRLSPVRYLLDYTVTECWVTEPKLTYHDGYSTGLCKHDCVLKYTVKTCKCMPYGYSTKHAERHRTCTIEEMRTCVLPQIWNTENGTDPLEIQQCKRSTCLRMCTYWIHEPYLMLSQLRREEGSENTTKRTNVLNVYFGYMRFTQTEAAQLMTFDTFISNLGGAIGLWTGMSLISIVQMLVYGWEGFWRLVERRRAEKMIKTMLAQHPAQNGHGGPSEKPIRIKGSMFVKPKVHYGAPQPPGHKAKEKEAGGGGGPSSSGTSKAKNGLSLVGRMKLFFKGQHNDHVQPSEKRPVTNFGFNATPRDDQLPPIDPKPRQISADDSTDASRQQSLGALFEPPPANVETVGAGAPPQQRVWTTTVDEENLKNILNKNGNNIDDDGMTRIPGDDDLSENGSYSNPGSGDARSRATAFTTAGGQQSISESIGTSTTGNNNGRARGPARHHAVRRNSRGSIVVGVAATVNRPVVVRKRTQSEHKVKRHPLSRPRY